MGLYILIQTIIQAKWITTIAEIIVLFYKDRNGVSKILNFFGISATASFEGDHPTNLACPFEISKDPVLYASLI